MYAIFITLSTPCKKRIISQHVDFSYSTRSSNYPKFINPCFEKRKNFMKSSPSNYIKLWKLYFNPIVRLFGAIIDFVQYEVIFYPSSKSQDWLSIKST